jgi:hypothetical protein
MDVSDGKNGVSYGDVTFDDVPNVDSSCEFHSDVDIHDVDIQDHYIEDFPWSVGQPTGKTKRTPFEKILANQRINDEDAWGPFKNEGEWDLARWLMTSGCSQTKLDELLMLPMVSTYHMQ